MRAGRSGLGDSYSILVTAIIGNVRAPEGDNPSLFAHYDLEGIFHGLGHAIHASLTRAPCSTQSGFHVEWDFVETPLQALEEWAWHPQVLETISGYYADRRNKLPANMIARMIEFRYMDAGLSYSRMLVISE